MWRSLSQGSLPRTQKEGWRGESRQVHDRTICILIPQKPKSPGLKPRIGTLSVVAIVGWVLTSHLAQWQMHTP